MAVNTAWWQTFMPALNLSASLLFGTQAVFPLRILYFRFILVQEQIKLGLFRQYFEHLAHFAASNEQNCLFQLGKCFESLFCATCVLANPHVFHLHTGSKCNRTNVVDEWLFPPWGSEPESAPWIALEVPPQYWPETNTLIIKCLVEKQSSRHQGVQSEVKHKGFVTCYC